jgi:hypothetical protein
MQMARSDYDLCTSIEIDDMAPGEPQQISQRAICFVVGDRNGQVFHYF